MMDRNALFRTWVVLAGVALVGLYSCGGGGNRGRPAPRPDDQVVIRPPAVANPPVTNPPASGRAPVTLARIPDLTMTEYGSATLTLSRYFADPDGDALTYRAQSHPGVVWTTVSGDRLTLRAVDDDYGATVRVTAHDPSGLRVSQDFFVRVLDDDHYPRPYPGGSYYYDDHDYDDHDYDGYCYDDGRRRAGGYCGRWDD